MRVADEDMPAAIPPNPSERPAEEEERGAAAEREPVDTVRWKVGGCRSSSISEEVSCEPTCAERSSPPRVVIAIVIASASASLPTRGRGAARRSSAATAASIPSLSGAVDPKADGTGSSN